MFRAMWADGVNLADPKIVKEMCAQLGMDPDAVALEEVVLVVPVPAESAARFSRLAGCPVVPDPAGGFALALSHGAVRLLPADALDMAPLSVPTIVGVTLRTDDAGVAATRLLSGAGIPHGVADGAVTTQAALSGGVALRFV